MTISERLYTEKLRSAIELLSNYTTMHRSRFTDDKQVDETLRGLCSILATIKAKRKDIDKKREVSLAS